MSNENKLSTAPAGAVAQKTAGGGALSVFADGASFNTALRMAQCLASSTVVPKEYHGNVGNCMIAIEMASRINTSPMMVMQNLYIVNGRPAWSSQWIIAMINSSRRYKTELQFEFGRDKADGGLSCRAWAEDYSGHKVYGPKITMNMANDEGWTSKNGSKWKTMPDVMIQYRAASFFGRMNCPDMIMGIYSQEEVLDMGELPTDGFALVVDPATGEVTEAEKDEPITQDQRQTLFKMATSPRRACLRLCITASPKRSWKWLRRRNLNPKLHRKPAIPFLPATSPISPVKSDAIRRHSRHTDRQVRKWHGSAYTKVSTGRSCGICISSSVAQSSRRRAS